MSVGCKPPYIMPFDDRGTFEEKMFSFSGTLTAEQTPQNATVKQVIYEGFQAAVADGVFKEKAGILVDEQFGAAILSDASANGFTTAIPVERSGQSEFDFEYGNDFALHIESFVPSFCKVLVRYNPGGDPAPNARRAQRLKQLSDALDDRDRCRFMFELLVPAEKAQLDRIGGEVSRYDAEPRPTLMVDAIHALQDAGVDPDVWKIEGLDRAQDCARIVAAARRDGRGEDGAKVHEWLKIAAGCPASSALPLAVPISGSRSSAGGRRGGRVVRRSRKSPANAGSSPTFSRRRDPAVTIAGRRQSTRSDRCNSA